MTRKSLLALLLVMMMACCAIFTAGAEAFTVNASIELNKDGFNQLMQMSGTDLSGQLPEGALDAVIGLMNKLSINAVLDGNAGQADVMVNGQSIFNIAGQIGDDGITVVTDLLPSYVAFISSAELEQLMEQMKSSMASSGFNMDAFNMDDIQYLIEAAAVPVTALFAKVAASFGPVETGSWDQGGVTFTSRQHLDMTTKELILAALDAAKTFVEDEKVQTILGNFGVKPGDLDMSGVIESAQNSNEADMPALDVYMYSNDNGEMYFTGTLLKDGEGFLVEGGMIGGVFECHINTNPDMFEIDMTVQQNGEFYMFYGMNAQAMGSGAPFNDFIVEVTGKQDGGAYSVNVSYKFDTAEFLVMKMSFIQGGQITASFDKAGKTVLGLQDIMSLAEGGNSEVLQGLQSEITSNAMMLVTKLMTAAPEEMTQLMTLIQQIGR